MKAMLHLPQKALFDKLIVPWGLFLGLVAGFGACCLGGYYVSRQNHIENFERFHNFLTPLSQFYPTACQIRELARSNLDPHKIVVIVGGDSVLQGYGQSLSQVWTRKLQALLGKRYQVINFGLLCGRTGEFGATAAEFLSRDFNKLILITNQSVGTLHQDPDGLLFKYFFWDAYYKGLLLPHPERDARLREMENEVDPESGCPGNGHHPAPATRTKGERLKELRAEMSLDRDLHFTDLWNTLGYTHFFTVWTALTRDSFARARKHYADDGIAAQPNPALYLGDRIDYLHNIFAAINSSGESWWTVFERSTLCMFPEPTRKRTLILVTWFHPGCSTGLSRADQASYGRISRMMVRRLEYLGFSAMESGKGFASDDYADYCHLVDSGGAKMAARVAPKVRELAKRLGYTKNPLHKRGQD
jgi:hypothetical protein